MSKQHYQHPEDAARWLVWKRHAEWLQEHFYMQPVNGKIVVLRSPPEQFEGEMVKPDTTREHKPYEGWVIRSDCSDYKPGDYLIFNQWSGVDAPNVHPEFHVIILERTDIASRFNMEKYTARVQMFEAQVAALVAEEEAQEAAASAALEAERRRLVPTLDKQEADGAA